jgi:hypothetical protein
MAEGVGVILRIGSSIANAPCGRIKARKPLLRMHNIRGGAEFSCLLQVNPQTAGIFKGIFEIQKSTRIGENFAKIRALGTRGFEFTLPALTTVGPYGKRTVC